MSHPSLDQPAHQPPLTARAPDSSTDIDDFIYLISHDVRASVRALLELPQWIIEDLETAGVKVDGQVADTIGLMNRHTARLDRMLVDLLTYSRVGRMQDTRMINLDTCIDEVLDELALPAGFHLTRKLDVSSLKLGDRDAMVLINALLTNAIKHHDRQECRVVITTESAGGNVILTVSDDGPGIPAPFRERVFGAMTTLRPRDEVEGSGMGLANVRKISQQYGGVAQISDSPYGRGVSVAVELPLLQ